MPFAASASDFWGSERGREVVGGDGGREGDAVRGAPAGMASLTHSAGLNTINAALSFLERNKIAQPKCLGVLK